MVEVKRFELWTFRTSSERSNQLSYTSVPRDEPQPTALTMVIVSCFFSKSNTFFQKKEKYFCSFCKKRTEDYKQPKNSLRNCTKKKERLSSFPFPRVCFATLVLLMNKGIFIIVTVVGTITYIALCKRLHFVFIQVLPANIVAVFFVIVKEFTTIARCDLFGFFAVLFFHSAFPAFHSL